MAERCGWFAGWKLQESIRAEVSEEMEQVLSLTLPSP